MGKLFPKMNEHLRKGLIFCIFIYFPFAVSFFFFVRGYSSPIQKSPPQHQSIHPARLFRFL